MSALLYRAFKKLEEKYDAIVIGSGLGGLSVAAILAKAGQRALVLERHYEIGGYTHSFKRRGYEWDVGLHYVGQVHIPGTALNKIFRYISDEKLEWAPLDEVYDRAVFGAEEFHFIRGRENLKANLKTYFPSVKDQAAIDAYFDLLKKVENLGIGYYVEKVIPPLLARMFGPWLRRRVLQYSDQTTLSVLTTLTDNKKLIGVLTAQYGDYGLPPAQSSFYMHALLANHYMEGAAYPVGGSASLARTIIPVIEAAGGAVLFSAEVRQIIIANNTATGVEMADGTKLHAKRIISDAGIYNTFGALIPQDAAKKHGLADKLKELEPSCAHIGLYIGVKESPQTLHLPRCNYWVFPPEYDHELSRRRQVDFNSEIPVAYISFPAAKDPRWPDTHPNRTTVEAIIIVPYEWFGLWEGTAWKKRGGDYEAMKKTIAEQLLEIVYRVAPQLHGKVDYLEISTPLSTKKFTNHPRGEIYGAAHTPKRFRQTFLKPWTPVKNLFLTGQDIMTASIAGALMGGVLTASAILKRDVLGRIKRVIK